MPWRPEAGAAGPGKALLALLLPALVLAAGCGPRYRRTVVQDEGGITVKLRSRIVDGEVEPRGFAHPVAVSGIRLAHILSRIDVRLSSGAEEESGDRRPAVDTSLIYPLGDALSLGLARANESQEVVVMAIRKERRLGLFTSERLTSLVAWVEGERLVIHLARSDDLVPKGELDDLKDPVLGRSVQDFKVVATEGITPLGPQVVAVHWRDPRFREADHIRVGPTGRVMRRTILMEAPPEPAEDPGPPARLPSDPQALRELADLEELRRAGRISEGEYHRRRDALLRREAPPGAEEATPTSP